eukprot:g3275.t1
MKATTTDVGGPILAAALVAEIGAARRRELESPSRKTRGLIRHIFEQLEGDTRTRYLWSRRHIEHPQLNPGTAVPGGSAAQQEPAGSLALGSYLTFEFLVGALDFLQTDSSVLGPLFRREHGLGGVVTKKHPLAAPMPLPTRVQPERRTLEAVANFFRSEVLQPLLYAFHAKLTNLPPAQTGAAFQYHRETRRRVFLNFSPEQQVEVLLQFAKLLKGSANAGHPRKTGNTSWLLQRGESCLGPADAPEWYPKSSHFLKMLYELFFGVCCGGGATAEKGPLLFPLGFLLYDWNSLAAASPPSSPAADTQTAAQFETTTRKPKLPALSAIGYVLKMILDRAYEANVALLPELEKEAAEQEGHEPVLTDYAGKTYPRTCGRNVVYVRDILIYIHQLEHFRKRFFALQADLADLAVRTAGFTTVQDARRSAGAAQPQQAAVTGPAALQPLFVTQPAVVQLDSDSQPLQQQYGRDILVTMEQNVPVYCEVAVKRGRTSGDYEYELSSYHAYLPRCTTVPKLKPEEKEILKAKQELVKSSHQDQYAREPNYATQFANGAFSARGPVNFRLQDPQYAAGDQQLQVTHLRKQIELAFGTSAADHQDLSQHCFFTETGHHYNRLDGASDFRKTGRLDWCSRTLVERLGAARVDRRSFCFGLQQRGISVLGGDLPGQCALLPILHDLNVAHAADLHWLVFCMPDNDHGFMQRTVD